VDIQVVSETPDIKEEMSVSETFRLGFNVIDELMVVDKVSVKVTECWT